MTDFIFGGSKITSDGDCSHEIKRRLLLGRKARANLNSILKSRDITLPIKAHIVKVKVFLVVMYGCQSWTIQKAEHRRIDAFELRCWRRLLRIPWTARRSNQSILKEILEYSLEGWMLKLKFQYFWPPDVKNGLTGKDPDTAKDWGQEQKGATEDEMVGWHHWLNGHECKQTLGYSEEQGSLACCSPQSRKYHYSVFFKKCARHIPWCLKFSAVILHDFTILWNFQMARRTRKTSSSQQANINHQDEV